MKEALASSLLESAEMKLMVINDAPILRREICRLEAKVSKVGNERDMVMALKAKAEKDLTTLRIELLEKKVHDVTTINMDRFLRMKAEKELTKCKQNSERIALTIQILEWQNEGHRAKVRKIMYVCEN